MGFEWHETRLPEQEKDMKENEPQDSEMIPFFSVEIRVRER